MRIELQECFSISKKLQIRVFELKEKHFEFTLNLLYFFHDETFQNKHCNIFYFDSFALQQKKVERIETRDRRTKKRENESKIKETRKRENMKLLK